MKTRIRTHEHVWARDERPEWGGANCTICGLHIPPIAVESVVPSLYELGQLERRASDLLACTYDGALTEEERTAAAHQLRVRVDQGMALRRQLGVAS